MDTLQKLFSKDTRIGRTVRGSLQLAVTILAFFAGLLAIPGVGELVTENMAITFASFVTLNAIVTYTYNALEALLNWIGE